MLDDDDLRPVGLGALLIFIDHALQSIVLQKDTVSYLRSDCRRVTFSSTVVLGAVLKLFREVIIARFLVLFNRLLLEAAQLLIELNLTDGRPASN